MSSVSVIIPTFNRGALLQRTIDSALAQTLAPVEILVVDDGSTDGTAGWVEDFYRHTPAVRVIRQKNGGVARARNRGLREARGEWIAFLDHDDCWRKEKLEFLLAAATPEFGVVYSRWRAFDDSEGALPSVGPDYHLENESSEKWLAAEGDVFNWLYGWNCPIISMSVPIVRRELLVRIGGFDPRCVPADDWDLWLRLARLTHFKFVDRVLTDYAVHPAQQSRNQGAAFRAARRILTKYPTDLVRRPLLLWWLLWSKPFEDSISAYEQVKSGKSSGVVRALRLHPLALFAPQWVALLARLALKRF